VSRIRRSNISLKEGFMVIKVLKSKNDQLHTDNKVIVSRLSSAACPAELLKRYLAMFKIPLILKILFSSLFPERRAVAGLLPLINQLVTLLLEGLFSGTYQVSE